ncbi:hypothetical protein ACFE04_009918 [Oxalis oulophora]
MSIFMILSINKQSLEKKCVESSASPIVEKKQATPSCISQGLSGLRLKFSICKPKISTTKQDNCGGNILQATQSVKDKLNIDERQHIAISAKLGVLNRRSHHMQTCQITNNNTNQTSRFNFEKSERIFKNHFLTILFPIDRYSETGPSSRTFFSNNGFTCLQVLDHIYAFYQENMSTHEI